MTFIEAKPEEFSRAFQNLVRDPDDLVGLLAYAKYKQSIQEAARVGQRVDRKDRNLTPAMVDVLRSAAEQILTKVVSDGIEAAAPEIAESAFKQAIDDHLEKAISAIREERNSILNHVTNRTSFVYAFITNLGAWFVTLLVAVFIVILASSPPPEQVLTDKAKSLGHALKSR